jgi:hypothetical protein
MSIFNTRYEIRDTRYEKGAALLFTLMVMIVLTSVVGAYLGFVQASARSTGAQISDRQAIYLAEAGLQKAVWNLMRTVANGGQGENWTTAGTTESLGDGSYTMAVERWDWALSANNSTASATSEESGHEADKAIDGDDSTYWKTLTKPLPPYYENITIAFPYKLTINKARYVAPDYQKRPKEYEWQVSTDGVNYTTVFSNPNGTMDETNEFAAVSNVNYLRLWITKIGGGALQEGLRVSTVEAIGSKIIVTGTVDGNNRRIEETVAVDDASEEAYDQIDWDEI